MKSAAELLDPKVREQHMEQALRDYRASKVGARNAERPGQNDGLHGEGAGEGCSLDAWFTNALWN